MFRRLYPLTPALACAYRSYRATATAHQSKFGSASAPAGGAVSSSYNSQSSPSRGGGSGSSSGGVSAPMNLAHDSVLLPETRAAMRDDTICLTEIIKKMNFLERQLLQQKQQSSGGSSSSSSSGGDPAAPAVAAVSLKYLYNQLNPYVQEALSEKHDGLYNFLKQRKQYFLIVEKRGAGSHAPPTQAGGGLTYYVQVNPLLKSKFLQRDVQKHTIQKMMGISENFRAPPKRRSNNNNNNRSRGGRSSGSSSGRGGQGGRREYSNSNQANYKRKQGDGKPHSSSSSSSSSRRPGMSRPAWSSTYSSKGDDIAKGAMDEKVKHRSFGAGASS